MYTSRGRREVTPLPPNMQLHPHNHVHMPQEAIGSARSNLAGSLSTPLPLDHVHLPPNPMRHGTPQTMYTSVRSALQDIPPTRLRYSSHCNTSLVSYIISGDGTNVDRDKQVVKVRNFYEHTSQHMIAHIFRRYFRMNRLTLIALRNYIQHLPMLQHTVALRNIVLEKKIAMTCCYLGSSAPTLQ